MMKIDLTGKNVLVGGSTQGLGKAVAIQLAKCGASVTLMARNKSKLQKIRRELNTDFNQNHQFLVVDFYDFNAYQTTIKDYFKNNTVDILVNNTNGPKSGGVMNMNTEDYQQAFNLLFKTTQYTTMLALKWMKKNNFGRIINATSLSVKEPLQHLALSNTIRAAVVIWAKTLATDVGKYGITVNNLLTGIFDTERIQYLYKQQAKEKGISYTDMIADLKQTIPLKRIGNPKEFGYLVTFLASEYASYITGTNIPIDGGIIKSL